MALHSGMSETLYRRPQRSDAHAFSSVEGRKEFAEALSAGGLEGYFPSELPRPRIAALAAACFVFACRAQDAASSTRVAPAQAPRAPAIAAAPATELPRANSLRAG